MLTQAEISFFRTFGFLLFPRLMADRIEAIQQAFEEVWAEHGGGHDGKPHEGSAHSCLVPFIDRSEELSSLLDDPRILGIARALLGGDFNYMGSDGNFYVGDTRWHSDGRHEPGDPMHVKIAFYLDPLTRNTGALRLIPGSHLIGGAARFWADRKFGEIMVRTATAERRIHLEQVMANDSHLAELVRRAREKMSEPARG